MLCIKDASILYLRDALPPCRYNLPEEDVLCQVQHALSLVGMEKFQNRPTHTLSGGQKQRVAIAGALAECPKVCLFLLHHAIATPTTAAYVSMSF